MYCEKHDNTRPSTDALSDKAPNLVQPPTPLCLCLPRSRAPPKQHQLRESSSTRTVSADVQAEHPRRLEVAKRSAQRRKPPVSEVIAPGQHRVERGARLEKVRQLKPGY